MNDGFRGKQQAILVGRRLSIDEYDKAFCSDLTRCKQTAQAIIDHQRPGVTIPMDYRSDIRERGFGSLSGKPISYLMTEAARRGGNMDHFVKDNGGETTDEFEKRVIQAYQDILKDIEETDADVKRVLVVTHGGPLKVLARYWIEQAQFKVDPANFATAGNHGNTAVTRIQVPRQQQGQNGFIELLNSTTHLGDQRGPVDPPPSV
ncbi:histidine phosphatase superfamily [Zychaea mexicana]|uniref:histidine phosphatase superfamily n=1 Tax=Zychaea mexicana TaxID=64656 RepID=UPI0022FF213F|nr:histidine phosphatase superfamily [Zychaea mexicana]KAI9496866.1 histidine phosphatase superfamily [Zychaea mexicana]